MSAAPQLYGGNKEAYNSREREILIAGAAGSGKTVCALSKVRTWLEKYPGCRGLFCRGTRSSLTESGLVTWEQDILGENHRVLRANPNQRKVRQSYRFPNGSELIVRGLDDPGKTLSSQYDFVYIQEATEEGITLGVYETLLRALRNGKMVKDGAPYHQIVMDCNPTTPTHWLYKRQLDNGPLKMFTSTHRDNPAYWNRDKNDYTPIGREYIENTLARMTGARRARFYLGLWQAAVGLVYDGYDPAIHNHPRGWMPPRDWRRVWGIDWGFTNPTCLAMWALDPDDRLHFYKEYYATHTRAEELAKWAREEIESGREPMPIIAITDHDPEAVANFRVHGPRGIGVEMADKGDKTGGIEAMQELFDVQADGRPRIFFVPDARANPVDENLRGDNKPASGLEELLGYMWDVRNPDRLKDEPLDKDNHWCDQARYVCRWVLKNTAKPAPRRPKPAGDPFSRLGRNTWA